MKKQTICVDFDGVLHSYTSRFTVPDEVLDRPTPGALGWLEDMIDSDKYRMCKWLGHLLPRYLPLRA